MNRFHWIPQHSKKIKMMTLNKQETKILFQHRFIKSTLEASNLYPLFHDP